VAHGSLEVAIGVAFTEVLAFVVKLFAAADGEGDFDAAGFPVEGERDEGMPLDGGGGGEFSDLALVEEEFPGGLGLVIVSIAPGVFVDVGVVEPGLVLFDASEGVGDLGFAGAEGFDLGAVQDDAGLEGFEDFVVSPSFRVVDDVGHDVGGKKKRPGGGPGRVGRAGPAGWVKLVENGRLSTTAFPLGFSLDFVEGMFPGDFILNDLDERDIGDTEADRVGDEGASHAAAAAVQLLDPTGDEVHEDVRIAHLFEGFADQVRIHSRGIPCCVKGGSE
jgi:hypothetical protein